MSQQREEQISWSEGELRYFEQARALRSSTSPDDAEHTGLKHRARLLTQKLRRLGEQLKQLLSPLRDDLQLSVSSVSGSTLPTQLTLTLTRSALSPSTDAQLYLMLREEGAEVGFGFGMRNTRNHRPIREKFIAQTQRFHRKSGRYLEALQKRDYRFWPAPFQAFSTPSLLLEEWREQGGAVVRLLDRGMLVALQDQTSSIVAQIFGELLGLYGFLDRVYTAVPTIRPLHIESPEALDNFPAESHIEELQDASRGLLLDFLSFARSHHFHFPPDLVRAYLLSLQTRPMVILSGVAGTGKSQLALLFAQFMSQDGLSAQDNPNIAFIPVRPDWLDPQALLGYYDTISEGYRSTPFLQLLLRATQDLQSPYFAILDELNLARVEFYFSDFLSILESRRYDERGQLVSQAPLHLHQAPDALYLPDPFLEVVPLPGALQLPPNLYITGTVNIDETTHRLSPKVLDRVNLLEVTSPSPSAYLDLLCQPPASPLSRSPSTMAYQRAAFTRHGAFTSPHDPTQLTLPPEHIATLAAILDGVFAMLQRAGFGLGLRMVQEILDFAENCERLHAPHHASLAWILDRQLLQKVLPRLHGPRQVMEPLLSKLLMLCWPERDKPSFRKRLLERTPDLHTVDQHRQRALGLRDDIEAPDLPQSAEKIARMLEVLEVEPYVEFWR